MKNWNKTAPRHPDPYQLGHFPLFADDLTEAQRRLVFGNRRARGAAPVAVEQHTSAQTVLAAVALGAGLGFGLGFVTAWRAAAEWL